MYELQMRSGVHALRFPQRAWSENELSHWLAPGVSSDAEKYLDYWRQHRRSFFFQPGDRPDYAPRLLEILREPGARTLADEASRLRNGEFKYFSSQYARLSMPPDWHSNPFTGQRASPDDHWSRIPMFSCETGDLKFIWEPGRFASAYILARAYWATGDAQHCETFWQLVERWRAANPPNHGAHWKCGQETSLRLMAWCFALYAFADSDATSADRLASLIGMIAAQADRVSADHVYARLQRNNHSIGEGVGLWTVGLLFPELERAAQWRAQGREILTSEARRQIASDGSYIQNSTNYHRLMLHDYLWAIRLGRVCGDPLPDLVLSRIERAVEFLYQVQDAETGEVPCYGPNDGALVLPLNSCSYADFRPVITAVHYLVHGKRLYEAGGWDEDLLWLFGPDALNAPMQDEPRKSFAAPEGGYYTLRGERGFALTRCGTYHYRPAQADMLHLDLWWRGVNVVCDPGSYLYYADPPWDNNLKGTDVHSTVSVDGNDQMVRGPRFLWFDWSKAETLSFERGSQGNIEWFQGQHHGYARLRPPVIHRRAVARAGDDLWLVVDDLLGEGSHSVAGHWLLHPGKHVLEDNPKRLRLSLPGGTLRLYWHTWQMDDAIVDLSCGDESEAPRGWRSRYYGVREPALSFKLTGVGRIPCRVVWVFDLGENAQEISFDSQAITVSSAGRTLEAKLSALGSGDCLGLIGATLTEDGLVVETLSPR
jgi:asparagine synthase (glutamine-hydrolysing)